MKPARLRAGDVIAVVSPSWGGPAAFPERFERGLAALAKCGLRPRVMPHARGAHRWVSGTIADRVADLHEAFADPGVKGIITSIGGSHSSSLLPFIDFDLIAANPKVFCGYSDITVLHHAIHARTGLVTFYGPAVMPEFGEWPGPDDYTLEHFVKAVMEPAPIGAIPTPPYSVHEHRDWALRPRPRRRDGPEPLVSLRPGTARGKLLVACLPSARNLIGTPWLPEYRGRILVLETPEQPYGPPDAERDLWHLRNAGLLSELGGLVLGRGKEFTALQTREFHEVVLEVVSEFEYPVLANLPVGHVSPIATLPIGVEAELEAQTAGSSFAVIESGVV
jgi:muramoyltetrapeptide carboxypeptidase